MKAITLISGGLDSTLAAKVVQEQGIEVIPLYFRIPFCQREKKTQIDNLSAKLKIVDIQPDFLKLVKNPKYGFGSNMNPCIDCKILMLAKAKDLMPQLDAAFVVTGEVLGQRPMSQHRKALELIEKKAGLEGLLLRPLSARLLEETIPEKKGWVNRDKLWSFSGRTRKPQMELASRLGIKDYPNPAGGCLLTDPEFSRRLKDLIAHQGLNIDNIELLKVGRHFRFSKDAKLIVGRNEKENRELVNLAKESDYLFFPDDALPGPTALGRGKFSEELLELSCRFTCRYCDLNGSAAAGIMYQKKGTLPKKLMVAPIEESRLKGLRI